MRLSLNASATFPDGEKADNGGEVEIRVTWAYIDTPKISTQIGDR